MKVHQNILHYHQKKHRSSKNYRYIWDVSYARGWGMAATMTWRGHGRGMLATVPPVNRRKGLRAGWAGPVRWDSCALGVARGLGFFCLSFLLFFSVPI